MKIGFSQMLKFIANFEYSESWWLAIATATSKNGSEKSHGRKCDLGSTGGDHKLIPNKCSLARPHDKKGTYPMPANG